MISKGKIVKGIGGFYYIRSDADNSVIECKARGKFRNMALTPIIGDVVDVDPTGEEGKGSIVKIYDRKNSFIRPAVANIDRLVIVVACNNPKPDFGFVDKMLVIAHVKNVEAVICFNKTDLEDDEQVEKYAKIYRDIGYTVVKTSNVNDNCGIEQIKQLLPGKTTAFTGFSGVGKSTLLNKLLGVSHMETGEVSKKIGRGRHTTRHVELMEYQPGSYVVDTPGFSTLDLPDIEPEELADCFVEFAVHSEGCRFADCMHLGTKFCSVYDAVQAGKINEGRYNNYKEFYKTLKDNKEW
ncbi:MAG: ribosome small subunit-dependent GTPase A [Clostridia bacterium]|nr:ribosome small subunit-dependent GTPase A [Clostridia bacterium]